MRGVLMVMMRYVCFVGCLDIGFGQQIGWEDTVCACQVMEGK